MAGEVALVRVDVYSHHDVFLGTINEDELLAFSHSDENNGEDSVSISTLFPIKQDYRLVWQDWNGIAHEHICQDPKGLHANGATIYTDTALNSICETFHDYIEDKRPYSYGFAKALEVALEPTRWSVGTVDQSGTVSSGLTFYHTSCREALQAILECGGELETVITVDGSGVTKRAVNIRAHRGETATHKRFAYGKDVTDISRTEHWGAITACYGYGKGVETDSGGYGRKLTFGDINGGLNYVADAEALKKYGRPDGSGGFAHKFGEYENSDCEDAEQLLTETKAYLEEHKEPGVTYEANVIDLVQFGREWEGCGVGDDVQVVDTAFEPELRLEGRVSKLVIDYVNKTRTVTLGNVQSTLASRMSSQQAEIKSLSNRSSNWDATTSASPSWLQTMMNGLNEQFNASGASYCYTSFTQGTIWSNVPLDEKGKPTQTGASAIQLCSEGLRIADGTNEDGDFNWTTFGTGKGFTANLISAGKIVGGSSYWDLDSGRFVISDGKTESEINSGTYSIKSVNGDEYVRIGPSRVDLGYNNIDSLLTFSNARAIVRTRNFPDSNGFSSVTGSFFGTPYTGEEETMVAGIGVPLSYYGNNTIYSGSIANIYLSRYYATSVYGEPTSKEDLTKENRFNYTANLASKNARLSIVHKKTGTASNEYEDYFEIAAHSGAVKKIPALDLVRGRWFYPVGTTIISNPVYDSSYSPEDYFGGSWLKLGTIKSLLGLSSSGSFGNCVVWVRDGK